MNLSSLGFIGFGEAAFHLSSGLQTEGIPPIYAFDIMAEDSTIGPLVKTRAVSARVSLVSSLKDLLEKADLVLCATSAKVALPIAREAAAFVKKGQIYADLNSTSPKTKQEIGLVMSEADALFVDVAVMDIVPPHRHKVPVGVSGEGARQFKEMLTPYGMNITYVSERAGSASAIKMLRSIFMKGLSALLLETLTASHKAGVDHEIMASISHTLNTRPFEELVNMVLTRTSVAAERRVAEMGEVISTLQEMGLDCSASVATKGKLQALADLDLKTRFNHKPPEHYIQVLDAIVELSEKNKK
jgi:3-hydroxyisobutyrate dehydrogenase-like beta-hydroxyacid dehydrogenase